MPEFLTEFIEDLHGKARKILENIEDESSNTFQPTSMFWQLIVALEIVPYIMVEIFSWQEPWL